MPDQELHHITNDIEQKPVWLEPRTIAAFAITAIIGGGNAVGTRISNMELAPFWGASMRFFAAAILLIAVVAFMRLDLPRGRALLGVLLYGLFTFGMGFGFVYLALTELTAGTAMVGMATVPLLTLIFAVTLGIERFSVRGVAGTVIAALGIALVFWDAVAIASAASMTALMCSAASFAASPIVVKKFPRVHAVSQNAIGMLAGSSILFAISLLQAEQWTLPAMMRTQIALLYLVVLGSIATFLLYLFIVRRMTPSGANYIMLLVPLAATFFGWILLGETAGSLFFLGSILVLTGVFIGALMRPPTPAREK